MFNRELRDAYFYKGEILYNYSSPLLSQFPEIESSYKKALEINPDDIEVLLSLCKFNMFWKKYLLLAETPADKAEEQGTNEIRTSCHVNAMSYFRQGTALVKKQMTSTSSASDNVLMGAFHLAVGKYDDAVKYYTEALKTDPENLRAISELGVAQNKLKNFDEAIRNFQRALSIDPDDLDVQSNLADAYLNAEKLTLAESCYRKILQITPNHVDASIGLSNFFKSFADKALATEDSSSAEEYFTQAIHQYQKVISNDQESERMSRELLPADKSNINYSLGYCKVKLYELGRKFTLKLPGVANDLGNLEGALKNFQAISSGDGNYYKAQNAILRIRKQRKQTFLARSSYAGPALIVVFAFIVCVGAQYLFFYGRPASQQVFHLSKTVLLQKSTSNKIDSAVGVLNLLGGENFSGLDELKTAVEKLAPGKDLFPELIKNGMVEKETISLRQPISETAYAMLTFGGMIFIVVGLFLRQISRFKMGSIELEKTTSDTIATTPNLGVSKGM